MNSSTLSGQLPRLTRMARVIATFLVMAGGWLSSSVTAQVTGPPETARLVLPNPFVTVNGESATITFNSRARVQQVYASSNFAGGPVFKGPILIRALRWRPSAPIGQAFTGVVARLQIHLSTTQADPEELSLNFAANTGPDETLVFDDNIALSSAFAGPASGPKEFDIVVPLTTPFAYEPARGHLLVDLRNFSVTGASLLDAAIRTNDLASRVFAGSPLATMGTGHDISADIIAIEYSLLSEPPSIVFAPRGHLIVPGESTTLRVVASGTAALSYQWRLNGIPLDGATNASLAISGVQAAHAGSYTVDVANPFGTATSPAALLTLQPDGARIVVPNFATNQVGGAGASTLNVPERMQQVYGSNQFRTGSIAIREIRFRAAPFLMVDAATTISNLEISLSTTAVPGETPTSVFVNNTGPDETLVFRGAVSLLSGAGPRTGLVQPFDIFIPLDTPFFYEPAVGNLVVDIRNFSGSQAPLVDTSARGNDSSGRAFAFDVATPLPTTIDGGADVLQLIYSPTSAPPVVLSPLQSLTRVPGESATFRVWAGGTAPFRYQWLFNGDPIVGRTNVGFSLFSVRETNAGLYSVQVENSQGVVMSLIAVLTILTNANLGVIPREYTAQTGGNGAGTFESSIRQQMVYYGTNLPGFPIRVEGLRWRPNAAEGRSFSPTSVDIQISLSTVRTAGGEPSRTFADNRGEDFAEVFRGQIALSSAFAGPAAGPKQFDLYVPLQRPFHFNGTQGDLLVESRNFASVVTTPVDAGGAPSARGRVWSDNPNGLTATTGRGDVDILQLIYVSVLPPSIVVGPQDQSAPEGSTVNMTVTVAGTAPFSYQWRLNSSPLAGQTNDALTLPAAQTNQSGFYSVTVSNFAGVVTSELARVTVFHLNLPPSALPQEVTLAEDSPTALLLTASDPEGDPLTYSFSGPAHGALLGAPPQLIYLPATNYFGPDSFTFQVNDGSLTSVPATIRLTILPVNDAPIAIHASLKTAEDIPLALKLQALDVDGDVLTYSVTSPTHGALSGSAPDLVYTPQPNYSGPDRFTFVVQDSMASTSTGVVTLAVLAVNDPPVASVSAGPLLKLFPGQTELLILAADNQSAEVILDGSPSSDIENDPLQFAWIATDSGALLATGEHATNTFAVGSQSVTLLVSDGASTGTASIEFEVITTGEALAIVISQIMESDLERQRRRPLIASLKAAIASFDRGNRVAGSNQLQALQHKISSQIRPLDPALAERLLNSIQHILTSGGP